MRIISLTVIFALAACTSPPSTPVFEETAEQHNNLVNNLIVNGDRCLYDEKTVCNVPFQALFTTDNYLNKNINVQGIFVIKKLHYKLGGDPSYHAFLFQSPEQYRLCDPSSSIELVFSDAKKTYDALKQYNGSYIYIIGTLLPRKDSAWRQLKIRKDLDINILNILTDSKWFLPKQSHACMDTYTILPGL